MGTAGPSKIGTDSHPSGVAAESKRTKSVTALQDWLSIRPVDQSTILEMVCRPIRAVLGAPVRREGTEFRVMGPGVERC